MKRLIMGITLCAAALSTQAQKHEIRLSPMKTIFGTLAVDYELESSKNQSFAVSVKGTFFGLYKTLLKRTLSDYAVSDAAGEYDVLYDEIDFSDVKVGMAMFSVTPQYRFYNGKSKGRGPSNKGFYYGPYATFARSGFKLGGVNYKEFGREDFTKEWEKIEDLDLSVGIAMNTFGGGFQMGYHWVFDNGFTIDWTFFGAGAGYLQYVLNADVDNKTLSAEQQGNIYQTVVDIKEDTSPFLDKLEVEVNEKRVRATLGRVVPLVRGNLSFGFRF